MIPDRAGGRWVRGWAVAAFAACVVLACERTAPSQPAGRRIVAIGGAVTETVFALGAGAEVVAVDSSSVYPDEVARLPQVGYQRTLSAEGILAQSPDLVIASDEAGPPAVIEQLRSAGVRVERMPAAQTPEQAVARITAIGAAIERPAAALAVRVQREIHAARSRVAPEGPSFVMVYARGAGTMMVSGRDTAGAAMIELAGGRNATAGFTGWKPLSAEALIEAAPEVIVVPARGLATLGGIDGLLAAPGVAQTPAGRARRIVAFDDLLLLGFGPRLGPAIDDLARQLRGGVATTAHAAP